MLDIHFDRWYANSEMEQPGKEVVNELIEAGIAEDERSRDGPVIVRIDEQLGLETRRNIGCWSCCVLMVLRFTQLKTWLWQFTNSQDYELESSVYVVDVRQSLHFHQVFKTLEIAGYPWANRSQHIPYEVVNLPGNVVMASRDGTIVLLELLIDEAAACQGNRRGEESFS